MSDVLVRVAGLVVTVAYASFLAWLFAAQPRTIAEVRGGVTASFGAYRVDAKSFDDGLASFRGDRFVEARAAFARADPANRDPRTQFYIAYSYYRQGWHRTHHDDELYKLGLATITRAISLTSDGRLVVEDPELVMHSADELKAELEAGLMRDLSDFDPRRLWQPRK
jgi:hypothetical protein